LNGRDEESKRILLDLQTIFGAQNLSVEYRDEALSPSAARNHLVKDASEDWLYFLDDDAYVPEGIFVRFVETASRFAAAAAIGGPNLLPPDSGSVQRATDLVLTSPLGTHASAARYSARGLEPRKCSEASLILCNLFIRTSVLGADPFPGAFICAEENAFLHRLSCEGKTLYYDPRLFNWHERRERVWPLIRQVFNYGQGRSQFAYSHPKGLRLRHLLPAVVAMVAVAMLAMAVALGDRPDSLIGLIAIYLAVCIASIGVQTAHVETPPPWWSFALFPLVHASYATGFLYGLAFRRPFSYRQ
jgi:hypothetical protein